MREFLTAQPDCLPHPPPTGVSASALVRIVDQRRIAQAGATIKTSPRVMLTDALQNARAEGRNPWRRCVKARSPSPKRSRQDHGDPPRTELESRRQHLVHAVLDAARLQAAEARRDTGGRHHRHDVMAMQQPI